MAVYQIQDIGDGAEWWDLPADLTEKKFNKTKTALAAAKKFILKELPSCDYSEEPEMKIRLVDQDGDEEDFYW